MRTHSIFTTLTVATLAISSAAFAMGPESKHLGLLTKNDPLRILTEKVNSQWQDNNIARGTIAISARQLNTTKKLDVSKFTQLAEQILDWRMKEDYSDQDGLPEYGFTSEESNFHSEMIESAARAVAEGLAYDPKNKDGMNQIRRSIWVVLRKLDVSNPKAIRVMELAGQYNTPTDRADEAGEEFPLSVFVFLNEETNQLVYIYARAGGF